MKQIKLSGYRGITYPSFLDRRWIHRLWKKYLCCKEIHLFDEVETLDLSPTSFWVPIRYLYCDACGLTVFIEKVENETD